MVAQMKATSAATTIGFAINHSVAFATGHALGRGAVKTFSALRSITSALNSFAVILRVDGQRAALHGNTAGSKIGLPSLFLRPKLKIARAFNERFSATYQCSALVDHRRGVAAAALSSSGGCGMSRELPEMESSSSMVMVDVRDYYYFPVKIVGGKGVCNLG
jgi:hypothetical protein